MLYGAESKDPGNAGWQMLLGAFWPRTAKEDKKSQPPSEAPNDTAGGRSVECRADGARILFGIDFPALPGWADVWRSALRALHLQRSAVSFLPQPAAGKS